MKSALPLPPEEKEAKLSAAPQQTELVSGEHKKLPPSTKLKKASAETISQTRLKAQKIILA